MKENKQEMPSAIKVENNMQIIDLESDLSKFELLSLMFHKETKTVDSTLSFDVIKSDKKRYFEDSTVCYTCGLLGHVSRDCTSSKPRNCIYCDLDHKGYSCEFLLCDNCLKLGHTFKFCKEKPMFLTECKVCLEQNHYTQECPKVWRKYNLKNFNSKRKIMMSCPLCFSDSHFIDDCSKKDRKFTIFTKNYLKLIENPKKKYKRG